MRTRRGERRTRASTVRQLQHTKRGDIRRLQMTDVNRPTERMPRHRQTIRRSGSLLGFHGPVSRRIKLWTVDAKSDPTLGALERAYFTALEAVHRIEERTGTRRMVG
jgi:hypothetical protein